MKTGTAPDSMTTWVCSDVPEAMLVRAHAASNCERARGCTGVSHRFRRVRGAGERDETHLDHRVGAPEELDEAGDDAALDHLLDGRVALLREELAELHRRVELLIGLVGEDALDHGGELVEELRAGDERRRVSEGLVEVSLARLGGGEGGRTDESGPSSSSESGPLEALRLRRLAIVSSRFCFLISTCASSRRRRSSAGGGRWVNCLFGCGSVAVAIERGAGTRGEGGSRERTRRGGEGEGERGRTRLAHLPCRRCPCS